MIDARNITQAWQNMLVRVILHGCTRYSTHPVILFVVDQLSRGTLTHIESRVQQFQQLLTSEKCRCAVDGKKGSGSDYIEGKSLQSSDVLA